MSAIEYHVAVVMADRQREARQQRPHPATRRRARRTNRWALRRARLRLRPA